MKLNDQLNLVVPIRQEGVQISGYHTPISREVFEANYRLLAAVKAQLAGKGIHYQMDSGPRIAAMVLRDEGRADAEARGDLDDAGKPRDGGANALIAEITRLTTIIAPTADGWEPLPVRNAIDRNLIDAEEWDEALSALVFFTCHYALGKKSERPRIVEATASILNASTTPLSLSVYLASLPKSTQAAPSGAKAG